MCVDSLKWRAARGTSDELLGEMTNACLLPMLQPDTTFRLEIACVRSTAGVTGNSVVDKLLPEMLPDSPTSDQAIASYLADGVKLQEGSMFTVVSRAAQVPPSSLTRAGFFNLGPAKQHGEYAFWLGGLVHWRSIDGAAHCGGRVGEGDMGQTNVVGRSPAQCLT